MIPRKIRLGLNTERTIDQGMMITIGQREIGGMIIAEMIDMMMTVTMSIVRIIAIIHQEVIGDHTRVTDTTLIDWEMMTGMIIVNIMIEGMKIEDLKELDNSNTRIGTMQNLKMLGKWRMRKERLVDQRYRIFIRVGKMVTMQINDEWKRKNAGNEHGDNRVATSHY